MEVTHETVRLHASSRTDAGVHAVGLPAWFETQTGVPPHGYVQGLNALLPDDVSIVAAVEVDEDFHVRHSGSGKIYRYTIWNGEARAALLCGRAWHLKWRLDVPAMQRSAQHLIGDHDFTSYRSTACQSLTSIRRLTRVAVTGTPRGRIDIVVEGNAFLQHMVRIIVGTLVDVGRGAQDEDFPKRALEARLREAAGPTAPAKGLTLLRVLYTPNPFGFVTDSLPD